MGRAEGRQNSPASPRLVPSCEESRGSERREALFLRVSPVTGAPISSLRQDADRDAPL